MCNVFITFLTILIFYSTIQAAINLTHFYTRIYCPVHRNVEDYFLALSPQLMDQHAHIPYAFRLISSVLHSFPPCLSFFLFRYLFYLYVFFTTKVQQLVSEYRQRR